MINQIEKAFREIRRLRPLVLYLTNVVTMDFSANTLLALGASPVMSVADSELNELMHVSSAVVINLGTLDNAFIDRCFLAAELACKHNVPIVLDPVGAGATNLRTQTARQLMPSVSIVKGNASEICALANNSGNTKGTDSLCEVADAEMFANALAKEYQSTVVVTGKSDFITSELSETHIHYGSSLMASVTGMGCALAGVIAAFKSINSHSFEATQLALAYYNGCGTIASSTTMGPASYRTAFIDALYALNTNELERLYAQ